MRFSVIVPVYNVAEYLEKCLDSVLPALRQEDEVILCLGSSADNSNEIAAKYAGRYSNIKIVWQNGQGLSNARNCAIKAAAGDYIICVDSDDYVHTEILRDLLERMRSENWQEDVIAHDFRRWERNSGKMLDFFQIGASVDVAGLDFLPQMLKQRQCFWNVWRFIYKREFLERNGICYLEKIMSEDVAYTTDVLLAEPEIRFVHYPFYVYTVGRGDSLMDKPTLKRLQDTVYVLTYAVDKLRWSDLAVKENVVAQFQFEYLLNMALIYEIAQENRKNAVKQFADWRGVLAESSDCLVRFASIILSVFGVRMFGWSMHLLKKVKRLIRRLK